MVVDIFLIIITLIALISGSITDLKKREVPDWISYSLIFAALGTRLIYSISIGEYSSILYGIEGFILFFALANLFYYTKQWGGGDAKIFMGLGAVLGLNIFNTSSFINIGTLFVLLLFIGAIYGIGWSIYLVINNKSDFIKSFKKNKKDFILLSRFVSVVLTLSIISFFFINFTISFLLFGISLILFIGIYSFIFVKAVEDSCMTKKVKSSQLTEGDWVTETIKMNGKIVVHKNNLGVTREQISKLKSYKRSITIKVGIPFIPAFLISYVALILLRTASSTVLRP